MSSFNERLNEADKTVHLVEDQWHYPIMVAAGYTAVTKEGFGFSRSYVYKHPCKNEMVLTTGINADYWNDTVCGAGGYHGTLQKHLDQFIG